MSYQRINIAEFVETAPAPQQNGTAKQTVTTTRTNDRGQLALATAIKRVIEAPDGTKHDTLNKMSFLLGGYVAAGLITEAEAVKGLQDAISKRANVDSLADAEKTILKGVQDGKIKPVVDDEWMNTAGPPKQAQYHQPKPLQPPPEKQVTKDEIKAHLQKALIDFNEELPPPPVCLEVEQNGIRSILGVLGDFTLVTGKAKSRKTFFITVLVAAAISNGNILGIIKGSLPEDKRVALFFDTEQSRYYVLKAAKRVLYLAGPEYKKNFRAYSLRKYSPSERMQIIENALYSTANLGVVVIDGVRDLITSINDEEQASMMASKLLKWTEELNIHIVCVLHQNKGNTDARGHVGAELTNKAGVALSIARDTNNKDISVVTAEQCRDIDFEPFAFEIALNGIPQLVDHWNAKQGSSSDKKANLPADSPISLHSEVLKTVFDGEEKLLHSQLLVKTKYTLGKQGIIIGDNKVRDYITYYVQENLITQHGTPGTKNSHYKRNTQPG